MSTKKAKLGISKDNLNQIINALGTAVLYKLVNGQVTIGEDTTNLTELKEAVDEAVESVADKANVDGNYPTLAAGKSNVAGNLEATKGLTVNDDPMSYGIVGGTQKSAVGDGNASLNKLVCVDVVRNQLLKNPRFTSTSDWTAAGGTFTVSNNIGTFTATQSGGLLYQSLSRLANHKYLIMVDVQLTTATDKVSIYWLGGKVLDVPALTTKQHFALINEGSAGSTTIYVIDNRDSDWDAIQISNFFVIDLTQCYGNNEVVNAIIGTGTDAEKVARLLAFDPEILSVGVNQWDEEWEVGTIDPSTGAEEESSTAIRSGPIYILPDTPFYTHSPIQGMWLYAFGKDGEYLGRYNGVSWEIQGGYNNGGQQIVTPPSNCSYIRFVMSSSYGTVYHNDICINISDPNINGKYYPSKRTPVTLPNYEGHGILKVVDGKVVADGTELYPDGNSKKRFIKINLGDYNWSLMSNSGMALTSNLDSIIRKGVSSTLQPYYSSNKYAAGEVRWYTDSYWEDKDKVIFCQPSTTNVLFVKDSSFIGMTGAQIKSALNGVYAIIQVATEEDITTPVFQSTFPVEQGGTLQFLDEDDNPIAGLQGSEIFYQKNIKTFVEALGEATNWDPERIKRLGNLSFTPEYEIITLNPSFPGAYARAQVYNATFTIVISAALTGTANGSITFQDSEVDLSNLQTKPAESIIDMDGKKVSEAPTTADCNIASFVGRSKSGTIMWSLLHSGVNKVKIHIEESVPLDSSGNGKIDCRASMIL